MLAETETTTRHDLDDMAFKMDGSGSIELDGQSTTVDVEQYYLDGELHINDPHTGWQTHPEAEFGVGGDIELAAFTDEELITGEEIVERDGEYLITIEIDPDRHHEFFTAGIQNEMMQDVEFADFSQHTTIDTATMAVDPDTETFAWVEYEATTTMDADEMEELGMEPPADDVEFSMTIETRIDFDEFDDPVEVSLPPTGPR